MPNILLKTLKNEFLMVFSNDHKTIDFILIYKISSQLVREYLIIYKGGLKNVQFTPSFLVPKALVP
jgi:hypothetical protein